MIDVKLGVRTAFYQALNGNLTYNSASVPLSDDMAAPNTAPALYVVLAMQTGAQRNTFSGWASDETMDIDIIYKTSAAVDRSPIDAVAAQILELICPTINTNGLPSQPGMQFLNVILVSDRYLSLVLNSSNTVERRLLTFKMRVAQL